MNRQKLIIALVALALIGGTAGLLANLRSHQKLGPPAVKTSPLDDTIRVQVELPARVLDYESTNVAIEQIVFDILPKDTSFGQRLYFAPDGFNVRLNVVLWQAERGGRFRGQHLVRLGDRVVLFRPDRDEHEVTEVECGERWVLSIGAAL